MGGEDNHARIAHADAHRHHEVGGVLGGQRALSGEFVAIVAAGFEAVMAVGDEHRLARHERGGAVDRMHIGHGPEAVEHAEVVGCFEGCCADDCLLELVLDFIERVGIDAKDLADVGLTGAS